MSLGLRLLTYVTAMKQVEDEDRAEAEVELVLGVGHPICFGSKHGNVVYAVFVEEEACSPDTQLHQLEHQVVLVSS